MVSASMRTRVILLNLRDELPTHRLKQRDELILISKRKLHSRSSVLARRHQVVCLARQTMKRRKRANLHEIRWLPRRPARNQQSRIYDWRVFRFFYKKNDIYAQK